jgi:predicted metal-dependent hydrolase
LKKEHIVIADIPVEVWRKPIKNLNLAVYAPDGRVRISVPRLTSDECVQQAVMNRMAWIKKQRNRFRACPVKVFLKALSGEMHFFFGKKYPLDVVENSARHYVSFDPAAGITLHVRSGTTAEARLRLLDSWYREELKSRISNLLTIWQSRVGRQAKEFRIKRMKTRWGTCNIAARRLWLNLELAKKTEECLELIVVHELVHLLERDHNEKFYGHMDRLLPDWRSVDVLLKQRN